MDDFNSLIGQIYDAAIDPTRWTAALGKISTFTDVSRATLILEDIADPQRSVAYHSYADPEWIQDYFNQYMVLNPMRLAMLTQATPGDVILTSDFMTAEEYGRTRFATEFLAPRGIVDVAAAVLEKTASTITVLSLKRSAAQGFADERVRRALALVAPHVRRAATISRILEQHVLKDSGLADLLDALTTAVFLLDRSGRIVHANASAARLTGDRSIFSSAEGELLPRDPAARQALADALAAAQSGDAALGTRGLAIRFADRSTSALVGIVLPLTTGERNAAFIRTGAVAALCIRDLAFSTPSSVEVLKQLYKLTGREMSVLVGILEQGSIKDTAAALGLTEETARGYLKAVFQKTGARRQGDLIKIAAGLHVPLG